MTRDMTPLGLRWQRRAQSWKRTLDDLLPWRSGRLSLWLALIGLVLATLVTLVWLAGRYEASHTRVTSVCLLYTSDAADE